MVGYTVKIAIVGFLGQAISHHSIAVICGQVLEMEARVNTDNSTQNIYYFPHRILQS